ncbi:MAG: SpoIIE family protein phosphatase [bacterium]|nr:SpoIIE family protein phosphatase [bacterium]
MPTRSFNPTPLLLAFGLIAFGLAGLSIADMFSRRPYDGVMPKDVPDQLIVAEVIPGSGADLAGIETGDRIAGIARDPVMNARQAADALKRYRSGDEVIYFVIKAGGDIVEPKVRLGLRRIGDGTYFYSSTLGFAFFLVGLFVLVRQPTLRVSQVFFLLCGLFLLFLVCRMRPSSYSGVDSLVLSIGTIAFLLLPAAFLHFYLLFPRPAWLNAASESATWRPLARLWRRAWPLIYVIPPLVFVATLLIGKWRDARPRLTHGAPASNWWLLAVFLLLGLAALVANSRRLMNPRERRGMALVLIGSFFGLVPFVVTSLVLTIGRQSETFFFLGVMPLVLVPLTFAYAIVRFQLLDIRVILRRSLLYTVTTALVTGLYAGGIATFNAFFRGSSLAKSGYFPIFLALAIVLLFDPLRRRVQDVIDRYFFAGRSRLERAMVDLGEAMTAQTDLQEVVEELVARLPQLLGLRFAALYMLRGYKLERVAGPETLPVALPVLPDLQRHLQRRGKITRLDQLGALPLRSREVAQLVEQLLAEGVEALGDLASRRRHIGMVLLSGKTGQIAIEKEELELLERLLHQAALALETSLLLEERTQKAELEREIAIAADIQAQLLPAELRFSAGWDVAAECRPARVVGGDFFAELPTADDGSSAVIFGDVSGKSVAGALMMMAAHEALYALALTRPRPADLFALTNRRLYELGKRSFVALGYFAASADGRSLRYLVAGQPPPLLRRFAGEVEELPLPEHRIPIGALPAGEYHELEEALEPGDVVLGYSDGVTDARSPDGEFFGYDRLRQVLTAAPADASAVVADVLDAVRDFTRGGIQYDDVTLVAVGRRLEASR